MRIDSIAVLVSGGGSNLQSLIDAIGEGRLHARICAVIADRDCYALERARKHHIPALCLPPKACDFDAALLQALGEHGAQALVLAGFLSILGASVVAAYRNRIINIHPALIPSFCGMGFYGRKVHQVVLDYGCKLSGATVHLVDEGADTGPIVLQASVPVLDDDDAASLAARVLEQEHALLPQAVELLCAGRLKVDGRRVSIVP